MEATPLASLSLTHVHYNPNDPISYLCAWLALVPQALCVIYVTLIWSSREVEILLMFAGQMGCEALNFLLKRMIKEERPKQMNGKGYGMPSSHAQFASFFSVALSLFLLLRHQPPPPRLTSASPTASRQNTSSSSSSRATLSHPEYYHTPLKYWQRILLSIATVLVAAAVASSRVYLDYHTPVQVLVGCVAGVGSALGWFAVTEWARREGWVRWAVQSWVGKVGRWRDLVIEEDLAEAGWRRWCERSGGKGGGRKED